MWLNIAGGRSFNDLSQWPVMPWVLSDYRSEVLRLRNDGAEGAESGEGVARDADGLGEAAATAAGDDRDPTAGTEGVEQGAGSGAVAGASARSGGEDGATFRDLSKPVGALNPSRLESLRERMRAMQEALAMDPTLPMPAPYLYGTHYSTPGYVVYWLARAAPGHLLRLQSGRFDEADRLFASIPAAWDSVVSSHMDLKELIPEFFLPDPSFLHNAGGLNLGRKASGDRVDDVVLPPWAGDDATRFLAAHRLALESPATSASLHKWIDLVFGALQRGEGALQADNLFYPVTYFVSDDPGDDSAGPAVDDPTEQAAGDARVAASYGLTVEALQQQIYEFGQCPRQLFLVPHPPRRWAPDADAVPATVAPGVDAASLTELAFQSRPVSEPNLVPEDTDAADTGASNAGQGKSRAASGAPSASQHLTRCVVQIMEDAMARCRAMEGRALDERHTAVASGAVQGCLLAIAAAAAAISTADPDLQALTAAAEAAAERAVAEREARRARDIASQERDAGVGGVTDGTRVDEGGKPAATGAATGDDVPGETPLQGQPSAFSKFFAKVASSVSARAPRLALGGEGAEPMSPGASGARAAEGMATSPGGGGRPSARGQKPWGLGWGGGWNPLAGAGGGFSKAGPGYRVGGAQEGGQVDAVDAEVRRQAAAEAADRRAQAAAARGAGRGGAGPGAESRGAGGRDDDAIVKGWLS